MKKISFILLTLLLFSLPVMALEGTKQVAYGFLFKKIKDVANIFYVMPNSPAHNILLPGDKILKINDKSIAYMNTQETLKLLEGPEGTVIKLELKRDNNILIKELTKKETFISDYITIDNKHYMNWKEIQLDNDKNVYTWVKFLNSDMNNKNLSFTKSFWGINCNSYFYTELEYIEYYKDGSYYQKPSITKKNMFQWSRIAPNTVGYVVARYACYIGTPQLDVGENPDYDGVVGITPQVED